MYSTEQRRVAIETFIRFDYSYADTIAELEFSAGLLVGGEKFTRPCGRRRFSPRMRPEAGGRAGKRRREASMRSGHIGWRRRNACSTAGAGMAHSGSFMRASYWASDSAKE